MKRCLALSLLLPACASSPSGSAPVVVAPVSSASATVAANSPPPEPVLRPEKQLFLVPHPRFVELHAGLSSATPPERLSDHLPERFRPDWQRLSPLDPTNRLLADRKRFASTLRAEAARGNAEAAWLWAAAGWLLEAQAGEVPSSQIYGNPLHPAPELTAEATQAYEKAQAAAKPGDQAWLFAGRRLLSGRWRPGQEKDAAEFAQKLAERALGDIPGDLWIRAGTALGALGRHEEAAKSFHRASDPAHRDESLALQALAHYRAGQPQEALSTALTALDSMRATSKAASAGGPLIERWGEAHDVIRRVASDAVDLLGLSPDALPPASPEAQAFVLGVAARRALYRGNDALARARAQRALDLAPRSQEAASPLGLLRLLAERAGDRVGAEKYAAQLAALKEESTTIRLTPPTLEEEEAQASGEPLPERTLESLVRQCAEPVFWKSSAGGLGRLSLEARIYDTGLVEARVLPSGGEVTRLIADCLLRQATVALVAAPSLRVTIELARLRETPRGPGRSR